MPDLIAQGPLRQHRWRRSLPDGQDVTVGRTSGTWATPWDDHISRRHANLRCVKGCVTVETLPSARNPIFYQGRQVTSATLEVGEHFVIGETTFTITDGRVNVSVDIPHPVTEQAFTQEYLRQIKFRDADQRIEILSRLPEMVSGAATDDELVVRLVNIVMTGIARATAVAIVYLGDSEKDQVDVLHWDRRSLSGDEFRPSEKLIRAALQRNETVVHFWRGAEPGVQFTVGEDIDWAFCTPVKGDLSHGWAIYVAGGLGGTESSAQPSRPDDLRDDLKFTELLARMLGILREGRLLERRQASLGQFFSPLVMDALADADPDVVLAPREAEVSVLFCDLRGFSRESERGADDLLGLLNRVSDALGALTRHILAEGGVVGDFHGDAAMGFWGWPLAQPDAARRACLAALAIRAEFAAAGAETSHPLRDSRIGIGIATGKAVAGKIGTTDQVKVTVFGPVVNLASRLEGMTKQLRAPILIDDVTASQIRQQVSPDEARIRRLAVVRPYGMETKLEVSELLPPFAEFPSLSDAHIEAYESAVDALLALDWSRSLELLHQVPADDQVKDFLTVYIASHGRQAPPDWEGVIPLPSK